MESDDQLYYVIVSGPDRNQLLQITGRRETILTAALSVMMDVCPKWDATGWPSPGFSIQMHKIRGRS